MVYDISVVHMYHSGDWMKKKTTGNIPLWYHGAGYQVIKDTLFVVDMDKIFALDLNNWIWSRFDPGGIQLPSFSSAVQSWVHNGKIYLLDDWNNAPANNQLCCYNLAENAMEWINDEGDIPVKLLGRQSSMVTQSFSYAKKLMSFSHLI